MQAPTADPLEEPLTVELLAKVRTSMTTKATAIRRAFRNGQTFVTMLIDSEFMGPIFPPIILARRLSRKNREPPAQRSGKVGGVLGANAMPVPAKPIPHTSGT